MAEKLLFNRKTPWAGPSCWCPAYVPPLIMQQLSVRHHLFVGSLKLWANKAKVIADFLMRLCWAESPKMSSCLWIWCCLHPSRWPVNYNFIMRYCLNEALREWNCYNDDGDYYSIIQDELLYYFHGWRERFLRDQIHDHKTLGWYFHACGLAEEPREAKGPHVQHYFSGLSH